jgi:hypothetical protein
MKIRNQGPLDLFYWVIIPVIINHDQDVKGVGHKKTLG